jgi:hypothetical protein
MVDLRQLHCLSHIAQSLDRLEIVAGSYEVYKRDTSISPRVLHAEIVRFKKGILLHMRGTMETIHQGCFRLQ